jgi:hypothetical protein
MKMQRVLQARSDIYNQFQGSSALSLKGPQGDDFAAYYTSMFLIQDTGEAVAQHMAGDFSGDPLRAYLEFWGVMQAIIIQQDAISELHRVLVGNQPIIQPNSVWHELRNFRNVCAGHPANRARGVPAPQRTFMARSFGSYNSVTYELWDASSQKTTHPTFNLRRMIDDYDKQASQILQDVLTTMKARWP